MVYVYEAILTPSSDGWITANVPDLPGCISQGRTIPAVASNIAAAMKVYLETLILDGSMLPEPQFDIPTADGERRVYVTATVEPPNSNRAAQTMTSSEAATALGISVQRVAQLIHSGVLPARKVGRDWMVERASVIDRQHNPVRGGRPARLGGTHT